MLQEVQSWQYADFLTGMSFLQTKDGSLYVVVHGSNDQNHLVDTRSLVMHKYEMIPNQESVSIKHQTVNFFYEIEIQAETAHYSGD